MGTFNVQIEVGDPGGQNYETVEAMVDSGAMYTFLPPSLLNKLGVVPHTKRGFVLADGSRIERGFSSTWVRMNGEAQMSPVVFGDENAIPLLGAVTLEIFAMGIDPVRKRLISVNVPMGSQFPKS